LKNRPAALKRQLELRQKLDELRAQKQQQAEQAAESFQEPSSGKVSAKRPAKPKRERVSEQHPKPRGRPKDEAKEQTAKAAGITRRAKLAKRLGAVRGSGGARKGAGAPAPKTPTRGQQKKQQKRSATQSDNQTATVAGNESAGQSIKEAERTGNEKGRPANPVVDELAAVTGKSKRAVRDNLQKAEGRKPKPRKTPDGRPLARKPKGGAKPAEPPQEPTRPSTLSPLNLRGVLPGQVGDGAPASVPANQCGWCM